MKQKVVFVGPLNMFTGYGQHSCKVVSGLNEFFDVALRPIETVQKLADQQIKVPAEIMRHVVNREQQEPWEILLFPPKHLPTKGKRTLYFTMWESTRLQRNAVNLLNRAEVLAVPCRWCMNAFYDSGVRRPIRIVPLGIDTKLFRYRAPKPSRFFTFGCAGRIAHGADRKGLADVVKAFKAAFPLSVRDVRLHIKGFQDCRMKQEAHDARIIFDERYLTPPQYVHWLAQLDCFVSAAKAEGWGWHQQEAMAVGRPLIACSYGGLAEFFDATSGISLPFREVPAKESPWNSIGLWAKPDFDAMVWSMQWMYHNRLSALSMGKTASHRARHFSNEMATNRLVSVMREFGVVK